MPVKEIISSESVRLFEGTANELVPTAKLPSDMHGFAVVVPAGEAHEWKLDLLWRIAILYAAKPRILKSRARVTSTICRYNRSGGAEAAYAKLSTRIVCGDGAELYRVVVDERSLHTDDPRDHVGILNPSEYIDLADRLRAEANDPDV